MYIHNALLNNIVSLGKYIFSSSCLLTKHKIIVWLKCSFRMALPAAISFGKVLTWLLYPSAVLPPFRIRRFVHKLKVINFNVYDWANFWQKPSRMHQLHVTLSVESHHAIWKEIQDMFPRKARYHLFAACYFERVRHHEFDYTILEITFSRPYKTQLYSTLLVNKPNTI